MKNFLLCIPYLYCAFSVAVQESPDSSGCKKACEQSDVSDQKGASRQLYQPLAFDSSCLQGLKGMVLASSHQQIMLKLKNKILKQYEVCLNLVDKIFFDMCEKDYWIHKQYEKIKDETIKRIINIEHVLKRDYNPQTLWIFLLLKKKQKLQKIAVALAEPAIINELYRHAFIVTKFISEFSIINFPKHNSKLIETCLLAHSNSKGLTQLQKILKDHQPNQYSLQNYLKTIMAHGNTLV